MCLAKVMIEHSEAENAQAVAFEELFCENVARIEVAGESIVVYDLLGRPYKTKGAIREITFVGESKVVIATP